MELNMKQWRDELIKAETKKALPILTFPIVSKMGMTVSEMIGSSDNQAKALKMVAESTSMAASVSFMDLSIEAEAFGATVRFADDEVPTIVGQLVGSQEEADALEVPEVGAGRTGLNIEGVKKAKKMITDRPVLAGCLGPFSLAGRLVDVSEALIKCITEPTVVHTVLEKASEFIIAYIKAYKEVGADGIVMAEPLAGILSPELAQQFSCDYVKRIIDEVKDDDFFVMYHNCGNTADKMIQGIISVGADAYHFGNSIDMENVMAQLPEGVLGLGNVDPAGQFCNGTPESVKAATKEVMHQCKKYKNFVISSGCDIPPTTPWENVEAFFEAVDEFYAGK